MSPFLSYFILKINLYFDGQTFLVEIIMYTVNRSKAVFTALNSLYGLFFRNIN